MNQNTSHIETSLKTFNEETLTYSKIMSILCNINKDNEEQAIEELMSILPTITPETQEESNMIIRMINRALFIRPHESKSIIRLLIYLFHIEYFPSSLSYISIIFKDNFLALDALLKNNIITFNDILLKNEVDCTFWFPEIVHEYKKRLELRANTTINNPDGIFIFVRDILLLKGILDGSTQELDYQEVEREMLNRKFADEFSLLIKGDEEELRLEDYQKLVSVVIRDDVDSLCLMVAGNYFGEHGLKQVRFKIYNMLSCWMLDRPEYMENMKNITCFWRRDRVGSCMEASVLGLAAFFGAKKIVRYSLMNEIPVIGIDKEMAIAGGYPGMVRLLEIPRENTYRIPLYNEEDLLMAVIYHRNEIADYIIQTHGITVSPVILSISLDSYNFSFFMEYIGLLEIQKIEEVFFGLNHSENALRTVYETAAENGNISIFNLIFNIFRGVFLDDVGISSSKTPLFTAIKYGNKNIAQLLINNGSSLFKPLYPIMLSKKCNTPFEKARKTGMKLSFSENFSDSLQQLLRSEASDERECNGYIFDGQFIPHKTGPRYLEHRFEPEYSDTFTRRTMEQLYSLQ